MVKVLLSFFLISTLVFGDTVEVLEEVEVRQSPLKQKIQSFLDEITYNENSEFINVIFDPE